MQIQVNTDHNIEGHKVLAARIRGIVENALNRVSDHITRVEVHLTDESGSKSGKNDKRCMMEARLEGCQPIAVADEAATVDLAVDGAADKLARLIEHTLDKCTINALTELIRLLTSRHSQTSHERHHPRPGCRRQGRSIESSPSVSEAWLLSDRDDHQSRVTDGPLKGRTIGQLLQQFPKPMLGKLAGRFRRFPLLLKFLDVHEMLSVQVHPAKANLNLLPAGETPKTEAWVVLEAGTQSRIYAGLKPDTTEADLRRALTNGTVAAHLSCLTPKPGKAVFLPAGTVHSLGGDLVVFEIQQNSDVTFRLYDWDHVDTKTGKTRALQVDKGLACIDFAEGPVGWVTPLVETTNPVERERLFNCDHFVLWRLRGQSPFILGAVGVPRILVCIEGAGQVEHGGATYAVGKGDVFVLPAAIGTRVFQPHGAVNVLEIALPD